MTVLALVTLLVLFAASRERSGCLLRALAAVMASVALLVVLALALGWAIGHGLAQAALDVGAEMLVDLFASLL